MIRSGRSMMGLAILSGLASAAALEAGPGPDLSEPLSAGPGKRDSTRRASAGPRVLGPPETADQMEAAMGALLKRMQRLERNRDRLLNGKV